LAGTGSSRELEEIASGLVRLAERLRSASHSIQRGEAKADPADARSLATIARHILKFRRTRDIVFGEGLFADPAWDMLLDLFVSAYDRRQVSVSSLCIAAAAPATTALRWITTLEQDGLIRRAADPRDGRRVHISLTDDGLHKVASVLKSWTGATSDIVESGVLA
jgi:hypothetical protein